MSYQKKPYLFLEKITRISQIIFISIVWLPLPYFINFLNGETFCKFFTLFFPYDFPKDLDLLGPTCGAGISRVYNWPNSTHVPSKRVWGLISEQW